MLRFRARRIRREDKAAATIDLNHDDFDLTPPRSRSGNAFEKLYPEFLAPGPFGESRTSIESPYDIARSRAQRDNDPFAGTLPPPRSLVALPRRALAHNSESYEMHTVYKPRQMALPSSSSEFSYSDPAAHADAFYPVKTPVVREYMAQDSDLSSSPPLRATSPEAEVAPDGSSEFRSGAVSPFADPEPEYHSVDDAITAPSSPHRRSYTGESTSFYAAQSELDQSEWDQSDEEQRENDEHHDDDLDSSSDAGTISNIPVPPLHTTLPPTPVTGESAAPLPQQEIRQDNAAEMHDSLYVPESSNDLDRSKSLSRPADAEERAHRLRSFYKDYFDKPVQSDLSQTPREFLDDSGIAYDSTGRFSRMPSARMRAAPPLPALPPLQQPMRANANYSMPRSMSTLSGRPLNEIAQEQFNHYPPQFPRTPMQPQQQRGKPRLKLQPLMPLEQLPTPHKIGKDDFLASPTSFAPPSSRKRGAASIVGGSPMSSPTIAQRGWADVQLRSIPSPHNIRLSKTFSEMEYLPQSRYNPTPQLDALDLHQQQQMGMNGRPVSHLPRTLVGHRNEMDNVLRPNWDMRDNRTHF